MNRRTLLGAGGTLSLGTLAGCLGSIQDLRLSTPIPLRIENETGTNQSLRIVAHAVADDRQTYDASVTAPSDQSTSVGHLSDEEQHLRMELVDDAGNQPGDGAIVASEETFIDAETQSVVGYVTEDGLRIDVSQ